MTPTDRLLWAYRFGHAWNPAYPNLLNLDEAAVAKMDGSEADAHSLIASWQSLDANVNRLVNAFHRRELVPDGDIGPASEAVMGFSRCAIPDYAPPPHASFHYDNPELQKAVESQQRYAEATGSGSWPVGCDPQNPKVHSVVVGIDTSNASSSQKSIMADVLKYVEETEAEIGQSVRHVLSGAVSPQHDVKFQNIPGSVIGFAYFPDPNTCRQTVVARIDNSFNARLAVLAELLTHEYKGHSDGLQHTNGGIMNPSIGSPTARASWKNDPSFRRKKAFFGGEPISPPVPPAPPAHPPVTGSLYAEAFALGGIVIRGDVQFDGKWKYVATPDGSGKYKLVPKAEV